METTDLTFTRSGETDLTGIVGNTEAGVAFVDRVNMPAMTVVDAGRIIVQTADIWAVRVSARRLFLTITDVEGL